MAFVGGLIVGGLIVGVIAFFVIELSYFIFN